MAKKIVKKVDCKKVAKLEVSKEIKELFEGLGISILEGVDFGFTSGTLVARLEKCDIQIKLIAPKAGLERYEQLEEEEEEEEEIVTEEEEIKEEETVKDEEIKEEETVKDEIVAEEK